MNEKSILLEKVNRKSMIIRESGRSTDYISPSFGYGCLYNCSYCYMKRNNATGLTIAKNIGDILTAINQHSYFTANVQKPNQTHSKFIICRLFNPFMDIESPADGNIHFN